MNLINFLKQTDDIVAHCSREQLALFIHDAGRVLPERYREDFLKRLKAAEGGAQEPTQGAEDETDFDERYKRVRNNLKIVNSQEVAIEGILNEEYDDWYDTDGEEFYYEDNSGISDILAEACSFLHICMDREKYKEGFEIGKQLVSMEILCINEYGGEEFSLEDMVYLEFLDCDLMQVFLDAAYCAYRAVPLKKRPEALYGLIVNVKKGGLTLEKLMQHGEEGLPDFQEFLTLWITYLGMKTERGADRLLGEAVGLLDDPAAAAGYAKEYAAVHPGLYLDILKNGKSKDAKEMMAIGVEAIKILPKKYIMRSKVALETAEYIIETDADSPWLEKCYFAAYESDTSAQNYLRALLNGYGSGKKKEELQKLLKAYSVHKKDDSCMQYEGGSFWYGENTWFERKENKPDRNMLLLLMFLDGQFDSVLEKGLNEPQALGWTETFMKQGIALFLLYLYEGQWSGKGITAMADIVKSAMNFSAEEYRKGTDKRDGADDNDLFCEVFSAWKSMVQMGSDIRSYVIKRITGLLEKRVEGIMDANRRNYYGECAAYIAALGEVQESMGEAGAKQRIMTLYKDKYSRRNAFRREMRNYGWIDIKRK